MRRSVPVSLVALIALVTLAAPAQGAKQPRLWATVNACDTASHPNAMGLRASMPGNGTRQRMYMRFRAQYKDPASGKWRPVPGEARSPWVKVGLADVRSRQAGWTFTVAQPGAGTQFTLRGKVDFKWKARRRREGKPDRWVTVKRRRRFTRKGLDGVDGGDPPGTSQARCLIR